LRGETASPGYRADDDNAGLYLLSPTNNPIVRNVMKSIEITVIFI